MAGVLNLSKGSKLDLSKVTKSLKFGGRMRWEENPYDGAKFDLDVWAFIVGARTTKDKEDGLAKGGRAVGESQGIVFYNQLESPCGGVTHSGDQRDGGLEEINFDFSKIDPRTEKVVIVCDISGAEENGQNFGMMEGAVIEILDRENNDKVLCTYELDEDFDEEMAINVGEFSVRNGDWRFKAVGAGFKEGMVSFLDNYGVKAGY